MTDFKRKTKSVQTYICFRKRIYVNLEETSGLGSENVLKKKDFTCPDTFGF